MAKGSKGRSAEEVKRLVEGFPQSGLTRGKYCQREKIPVTTLDYYRRRWRSKAARVRLVRVAIQGLAGRPTEPDRFTLVMGNGRRIESGWNFGEAELARLIRVAEAV